MNDRNTFKGFLFGFLICFNFMLIVMFDFWNNWESILYWSLITSTAFLTGFLARSVLGWRV